MATRHAKPEIRDSAFQVGGAAKSGEQARLVYTNHLDKVQAVESQTAGRAFPGCVPLNNLPSLVLLVSFSCSSLFIETSVFPGRSSRMKNKRASMKAHLEKRSSREEKRRNQRREFGGAGSWTWFNTAESVRAQRRV